MLDEKLLAKLKQKMDSGTENAIIDDVLLVFELFKQISETDEDLKEELEDMDIRVQQITTHIDKDFWLEIEDGKLKYGEGKIANPSFTFLCTLKILVGILYGEIDMTSAYMAGDITVEGNLQDAMAFQEIIELSLEVVEDNLEELELMNQSILNSDFLENVHSITIKNINISNFKSFQNLNFDFKKVNIILGPNNSGKSNILRLLLLLKQSFTSSLESTLILNGNLIDLGSFKDITYKSNMREIILNYLLDVKFQSNKTKRIYQKYILCEFHYSFNEKSNDIVINQFEIKDKNHSILRFFIDSETHLILNNLNEIQFQNKFFEVRDNLVSKLQQLKDKLSKKENKKKEKEIREEIDNLTTIFPTQKGFLREINQLNELQLELFLNNQGFFPELISSVNKVKIRRVIRDYYPLELIFSREFRTKDPKKELMEKFGDEISEYNYAYNEFVNFINIIRNISTLLKNLKESLSKFFTNEFYIGPLRVSPKRYYSVIGEIAKDVGFRGEFLPQLLKMIKEETQYAEFNKKINFWIKNFEMGTNVEIRKFQEIPELISIICKEYYSGFEANLSDMGIGTSQVLPIIIEGFLINPNSVLIIEQPEIHLHPKAQSVLGDLLIEIAKENKILIIETHSEHLIRRIQRKVAEDEISNEDVVFYYVTMSNDGSQLQKLDLNEDGYIKEIPDGFFEEDYKEVFNHLMSIARKKEQKK